jgi:acyl-coenzyme A synthetase/AMP-(fatty) acid ligase
VELTEIEGRIREFPGIEDATVIAQDDAAGGKRVVAYVVSGSPSISRL